MRSVSRMHCNWKAIRPASWLDLSNNYPGVNAIRTAGTYLWDKNPAKRWKLYPTLSSQSLPLIVFFNQELQTAVNRHLHLGRSPCNKVISYSENGWNEEETWGVPTELSNNLPTETWPHVNQILHIGRHSSDSVSRCRDNILMQWANGSPGFKHFCNTQLKTNPDESRLM